MLNLPALPLDGHEPDGSAITLGRRGGRWYAKVWDDFTLIDVFLPHSDPVAALTEAARNYPHATFVPPDLQLDPGRAEEIHEERHLDAELRRKDEE